MDAATRATKEWEKRGNQMGRQGGRRWFGRGEREWGGGYVGKEGGVSLEGGGGEKRWVRGVRRGVRG